MDLLSILPKLRRHSRMYIVDDRYATLVAFIDGYDTATDSQALAGFQSWLALRVLGTDTTGYGWPALVATQVFPEIQSGELALDHLPANGDKELRGKLISLLEEFLRTKKAP